ncbi:MAG: hypothetical protein TREMPRED_000058 [Tremellales sp. Tagirdzhanova-0007]|nr:MAG: hypothetical protein TREMPRED_000058 [Tremellales sp. Tagirdzhanova-0007]
MSENPSDSHTGNGAHNLGFMLGSMWAEFKSIVERISASPDVRVVILSSALERYFTAGLELTPAFSFIDDSSHFDVARKAFILRQYVVVSSSPNFPVIAAVFGGTVGLAVDIASACDIRLAASDTIFAISEVNVGLAADIGSLQRLPKIVGNDSKARELALTGRRFGAVEARDMGFVSDIVQGGRNEVIAAAIELGKVIAQKSPVAVVGTKHLMNHARDHTVEEGLDYTATWNMGMLQSSDTSTAMKAALSKQTAIFAPLSAPKQYYPKGKL